MKAAEVLSDGLSRTLPPSVDKTLTVVDPDLWLSMVKRGFQSENAPVTLVAKDPDLIVVGIGTHPQTKPSEKKTHGNQTAK
jgi:hypothetical protein